MMNSRIKIHTKSITAVIIVLAIFGFVCVEIIERKSKAQVSSGDSMAYAEQSGSSGGDHADNHSEFPAFAVSFPEKRWIPNEAEAEGWKGPFASSLRKMFDAGLPDPFGLTYHHVSIQVGNCHNGDSGLFATEGWLLPAKANEDSFVIAWNGLIYPLAKDHGVADLAATVARMPGSNDPESVFYGEEAESLDPMVFRPFHGLYLTRFGYSDVALTLAKKHGLGTDLTAQDNRIATDWMWCQYERTTTAHMRGDLKMVFASATSLKTNFAGLKSTFGSSDSMNRTHEVWVKEADLLVKESVRRAKAGKSGLLDEQMFIASDPGVAELIDALDRIQMKQDGQPGDVPLWDSPLVQALANKGNEAIEPLLDCLANDTRLTQSVQFWRSHHRSRTLLGVHEAALYALQESLNISLFELSSTGDSLSSRNPEDRMELARKFRAHWEENGRLSGQELNYAVLSDDDAGFDAWMDSAFSLLHKKRYDEETGTYIEPTTPFPGELLRLKSNPSVSDLLIKRITAFENLSEGRDQMLAENYFPLIAILAKWDQVRSREIIVPKLPEWIDKRVWNTHEQSGIQMLIENAADAAPETLRLFEAMAWDSGSDHSDENGQFVSKMMAKHGLNHEMKRGPSAIWTESDSPWCLAKLNFEKLENLLEYWEANGLLDHEKFRSAVLVALADNSVCATAGKSAPGSDMWFVRDHATGENSYRSLPEESDHILILDQPISIRRKDVAAYCVSFKYDGDDSLAFEYYWPERNRDDRILKLIEKMKESADSE